MTRIKICGVTERATVAHCARLGVDWLGYVFFERSPRFLKPERASEIDDAAPSAGEGGPKRVGLFVRPDNATIEKAMIETRLDALQIYDIPGRIIEIRNAFGIEVWHAAGIGSMNDLPRHTDADALIIEAPSDKADDRPGGLGRRFDWSLTARWKAPVPWLLAGGLTPDNVQDALFLSGAPAVDVSSGVESARGVKSPDLVEKFVVRVRERGCFHRED